MAARIKPPWIKSAASRNIAKRARALGIMRRKGVKPLTKVQARALCIRAAERQLDHEAMLIDEGQRWSGEIKPGLVATVKVRRLRNAKPLE